MWWFWVSSTPTVCLAGNYSSSYPPPRGSLAVLSAHSQCFRWHLQWCYLPVIHLNLVWKNQIKQFVDLVFQFDGLWFYVILLVIWCFIFFSLMRFCYWWLGVSMLIWCWIYVFFTFWNDARCPHWPFCYQLLPPRETLRWDGGSNRMFVANGKPKNPCRGIFDLVLSQEQGISNSIHINWFPSLLGMVTLSIFQL